MIKLITVFLVSLMLVACGDNRTTAEYLQSGQSYLDKKDWKAAIIEFKNAIKQEPENAEARYLLGNTYLQTFSLSAAVIELEKALKLGKEDAETLIALGNAYETLRKDQEILDKVQAKPGFSSSDQAAIHAIRALAYFRSNQLNEGQQALQKAQQLDDMNTSVRLSSAVYAKSQNRVDDQIKWLQPLLNRDGGVPDALSQMAEIEKNRGNLDLALKHYNAAIEKRQLIHPDYGQRALIYVAQNEFDKARQDINTLKKAGLKWPLIGHAEGLMAYMQKDYDAAQSALDSLLSSYPDFTPSKLILGLTHYQKNNHQNAINQLQQFLDVNPGHYQASITMAAAYMKNGESAKAIEILTPLKASRPDDFMVMSLLGNAHIAQNQFNEGIELLKQVVDIKPDQAQSRLQLGAALIRSGQSVEKGQKQIISAIELDPELQQAELLLFSSYIREKSYTQASKLASSIEQKNPDSSLGANMQALVMLANEKPKQAQELLEKTLQNFPADPATSNNLARIYLRDKDFTRAQKLFEDVVAKHPDNGNAYIKLATIASLQNRQQEVTQWLQKAVDANPEQLQPVLFLANHHLKLGDANSAVNALQSAEQQSKDVPAFMIMMARAKIAVEEYDHAIRLLKVLASRQPESSTPHFLLAQAYARKDQSSAMRAALEKTIEINPAHLTANIALARLDLFEKNIDDFKGRVENLIKAYPDNADVQFLHAKITSSEKDYQTAIQSLSKIMAGTNSPEVTIDLARNQWLNNQKEAAISTLELWIKDHPEDTAVMLVLAQYQLADNQVAEAMQTYERLDKLVPNNAVVLNNLAWLMKDSDPQQGVTYAKKALALDPDNAYTKDTVAVLLLLNNEPAEALKLAREAADVLPNFVDVQITYAKALSANGRKSEAKDVLYKVLDNTKNYDARKRINAELNKI